MVLALKAPRGWMAPLGTLTSLLAESVAQDFGERVLLLRFTEAGGGRPSPTPSPSPASWPPAVTAVSVPVSGDAALAVRAALEARGGDHAVVFLDLSALGRTAFADVAPLVDRPVYLTREPRFEPVVAAHRDALVTEVLPGAPPPRASGLGALAGALLSGPPRALSGAPYSATRSLPERCRVRLDLGALAAIPAPSLGDCHPELRASLSRWARAVTHRRVGLALGGGGAWALTHVALIEGLLARGVPVDLVAATGGGSLVGAYYCALGPSGLSRLVARGRALERCLGAARVSTAALEGLVAHDLGALQLEELEVPLYPAATNLSMRRREVLRRTSLAFGVRASSSAPGVFPSTVTRDGRYVEGSAGEGAPATLAAAMGAALVVAGPGLPPPSQRPAAFPPESALGRLLQASSPLARALDLLVSFDLLCHEAGDVPAGERTIVYRMAEHLAPLVGSLAFSRAAELIGAARADPQLARTLDEAERAYHQLLEPTGARPGGPVVRESRSMIQ